MLVQGVSSDELALGFLPFAYYEENKDKLKLVPVDDGKADNGAGPVLPSARDDSDGTYQPLSRPVFIYVSKKAAERPEVQKFVEFYLDAGRALVREVGYVGLAPHAYKLVGERFADRTPGSAVRWRREHGRRDHRAAARQGTAADEQARRCVRRRLERDHRVRAVRCARRSRCCTTAGIILVLTVETVEFLREVPIVEFLTGTEWTPLFADTALRRPAARGRHAARLGHRDGWWRCRWGCSRAIYLSEYAPDALRRVVKPVLEMLAGRADGGLRLLRADVRDAAPAARRSRSCRASTRSARAS